MPLLVAISGVVGRQCGLAPKEFDSWTVIGNLWGALIAPPAAKKTPAIKAGTHPLQILVDEAHRDYEATKIRDVAALEGIEAQIKGVRAAIKTATKVGSDEDVQDLKHKLSQLMESVERSKPHERRFMTNDSTTEKLGELLAENPNGLVIVYDELIGWLRNMEKPGREGDRAFALTSWDGDSSFTFDRIGRGTIAIQALCLAIIGGIQPGRLQDYFGELLTSGVGDDGLLQRFQLMVYPDLPTDYEHIDRKPNRPAKVQVVNLFRQLKSIDVKAFDIEPSGEYCQVPALRFSKDAQLYFNDWLTTLERRLRTEEFGSPVFEGHIAKYRSLMPSLALLFELVDMLYRRCPDSRVGLASAERAATWCAYLEAHARRIYMSAVQPEVQAAHALHKKLKAGKVTHGEKVRNIYRHHWSLLDTESKVRAGLQVLSNCNWLRIESVRPTGEGAPSDVVRLHPLLKCSPAYRSSKIANESTHLDTSGTSSSSEEKHVAKSKPRPQPTRRSNEPQFLRLKPRPQTSEQ